MNWKDIGSKVGAFAPLVGTLLGGPSGAAVGSLVANALGVQESPEAIDTALQSDPEARERVIKFQLEHESRLEAMNLEAETARQAEINKTMRAEIASSDSYVRRWRPTWGYIAAASWAIQIIGIVVASLWVIIATPESASTVINSIGQMIGALSTQWAVALAVLGINVSSRSKDKEVASGREPQGILASIARRISSG